MKHHLGTDFVGTIIKGQDHMYWNQVKSETAIVSKKIKIEVHISQQYTSGSGLTLSLRSPGFYLSAIQFL